MSDAAVHTTGQCRCGKVTFELHAAPLITMACHCTGCQRMTSSAFSLSSLFPSAALVVTAGEPVIGGLHGAARHFFCDYCMSWLYTRMDGMDELVNVRSTLLDNASSYQPFVETWVEEKLEWAATGARYSFDRFPPQEMFPQLLKEYSEQQTSND